MKVTLKIDIEKEYREKITKNKSEKENFFEEEIFPWDFIVSRILR